MFLSRIFGSKKEEIPLATSFVMRREYDGIINQIHDEFQSNMSDLPIKLIAYGIEKYEIKLEDFSNKTIVCNEPIYRTKVDSRFFRHLNKREIHVKNIINFKALDNKIWRIEIKTFCVYNCIQDVFLDQVVEYCNQYTNEWLNKCSGVKHMGFDNNLIIEIPSVLDVEKSNTRLYEGLVKTYYDNELYINLNMDIQNDLQPEDSYLIGSIHEGELAVYIKANTPISKIIENCNKGKHINETQHR